MTAGRLVLVCFKSLSSLAEYSGSVVGATCLGGWVGRVWSTLCCERGDVKRVKRVHVGFGERG